MAKGKKTGGRNFQPGNNANPKGRPRLPEEVKAARRACGEKILRSLTKHLQGDRTKLKAIVEDLNTPMLDLAVARVVYNAATKGDPASIKIILECVLGKNPDKLAHELKAPPALIIEVPADKPTDAETSDKTTTFDDESPDTMPQ